MHVQERERDNDEREGPQQEAIESLLNRLVPLSIDIADSAFRRGEESNGHLSREKGGEDCAKPQSAPGYFGGGLLVPSVSSIRIF